MQPMKRRAVTHIAIVAVAIAAPCFVILVIWPMFAVWQAQPGYSANGLANLAIDLELALWPASLGLRMFHDRSEVWQHLPTLGMLILLNVPWAYFLYVCVKAARYVARRVAAAGVMARKRE